MRILHGAALAAALTLALAGCAGAPRQPAPINPAQVIGQLKSFTVADLQAADADAKAHGDAVASMCYEALVPIVGNADLLPTAPPQGGFSAFQAGRDVVKGAQGLPQQVQQLNVPCAPLVLDVQQTLVRLGLIGGGAAALAPFLGAIP